MRVLPGQDVGDRILGAERGPAATSGGAQLRGWPVAQALREGREERLPAGAAERAGGREEAVGAAGGGKAGLVDLGQLVAARGPRGHGWRVVS